LLFAAVTTASPAVVELSVTLAWPATGVAGLVEEMVPRVVEKVTVPLLTGVPPEDQVVVRVAGVARPKAVSAGGALKEKLSALTRTAFVAVVPTAAAVMVTVVPLVGVMVNAARPLASVVTVPALKVAVGCEVSVTA
jgi:hypothetical protein